MKTLDEVIKSFEWCIDDSHDDCDGCPYNTGEATDCHVRNIDALHYLKEYQVILPLVPSLINTALAVQKKGKTIG